MSNEREVESQLVNKLRQILDQNKDKRVIVVGTTCTGKSSFLRQIKEARDMDDLLFPLLTKEEADYVNQTPWTTEIGKTMMRFVREKVKVESGKPVFGTVVLDSDLIVYLDISDRLLEERTKQRNVNFSDAKNMQKQIEDEIEKSNLPVVRFFVG